MKPTRKLYYEDVTRRSFCAVVLACEACGSAFRAALDATAFYPEGGGQPSDQGALGLARVTDVHEENGVIWHTVTTPLRVGDTVQGDLDWERRFDLMQQHTGEHIVSGIVHAQYGYDNVGFHIGADTVTVDFSGALTPQELREVERAANWVVSQGESVSVLWPTQTELAHIDYRSKKELTGAVRIVSTGSADVCACCGTHVRNCSEVGVIRLLSAQSYKGGVRVTMVCGLRAWRDYCGKCAGVDAVSALLSAKPAEIAPAVQRVLDENAALRERCAAYEQQLAARLAQDAAARGETLLVADDAQSPDSVRRLALALCEAFADEHTVCAVFAPRGEAAGGGFSYALASRAADVRELGKALNEALCGRGGGKPALVQGSAACTAAQARTFWAQRAARTDA